MRAWMRILGVLLLGWPLLQLAPAPAWLAPERAAELEEFARTGISPVRTISLYPFATVRVWLMLAGAAALFLLVRGAPRAAPWLAAGVLVLGLAEAVIGLHQYSLIQVGVLSTGYPRGTFGNRNLLAACLVGCYGAALGLLAGFGRRSQAWMVFAGATAMVLVASVVVTFSRMGIAALGFTTLLFGISSRRGRQAAVVGGSIALLIAAAVGLPSLARRYAPAALAVEREGRLAMWSDSLHTARRYWALGAGAGAFQFAFRRSHGYLAEYTIDHPHNEYLELAVEWGIPAALLLTAGLFAVFWCCYRSLNEASPGCRELGMGCLAGAAGILLQSAVDFPLRIPVILGLFSVLLGLASPATQARRRLALTALMAALGLFFVPLDRWNAETHYRTARAAFEKGRIEEAERAYRKALEVNPYAAPVWNELALLSEAHGDSATALEYTERAQRIEPHTRRGEWIAANVRLRLGAGGGGDWGEGTIEASGRMVVRPRAGCGSR